MFSLVSAAACAYTSESLEIIGTGRSSPVSARTASISTAVAILPSGGTIELAASTHLGRYMCSGGEAAVQAEVQTAPRGELCPHVHSAEPLRVGGATPAARRDVPSGSSDIAVRWKRLLLSRTQGGTEPSGVPAQQHARSEAR
eukprot:288521-Prymnesium_polylepis.1